MHAADSVAINRLQVKGDKRSSQALVRELEQSSWPLPLPAHLQHAWVLVREITVTGRARDLRQHTAKQLDGELQSAVRALRGNVGNANAIWFASLPELIAFLLTDLALGKTTQWYWSRWAYLLRYTKQEAIARLLCEHCEYLPAIFHQLQTQQQLGKVWAHLSDGSAKTIARELLATWHLPALHTWKTEAEKFRGDYESVHQGVLAQPTTYAAWKPLVRDLAPDDGRLALAVIIYGLTYTPLWLHQQPAVLAQAFISLSSQAQAPAPTVPTTGPQAEFFLVENQSRATQDFLSDKPSAEKFIYPASNNVAATEISATSVNTSNTAAPHNQSPHPSAVKSKAKLFESLDASQTYLSESLPKATNQYLAGPVHAGASCDTIDEPQHFSIEQGAFGTYEFTTQCGGFFYLLNPLHRLLTAERLAEQHHGSAWIWLLGLYRIFAQHFSALDGLMDAPLFRFMLQQLQPEATPNELQQLSLQVMAAPPDTFSEALFFDLHRHFCDKTFWCELQSSPGFFATPARVLATPSHWDIYFPLDAVRLDLRLCAWDTNPGWLPWLGRVVNMHYVEQAAPPVPGVNV